MKILLLGLGSSIKYIKKFLKVNKVEVIHSVFKHEHTNNYVLADEKLLELENIDYAIKSPGISETNQLYLRLARKFTFICELDLLYLFNIKTKSIVVSGTVGKTTLVSKLSYLFTKLKIKHILCGNSFDPITKYYRYFNKVDYLIIEQSSFQLHNLRFYRPYISLITNMYENHLDNSYSLNSYYENKRNIYKYQTLQNYFIYDKSNKQINTNDINATIIDVLNYCNDSSLQDNYIYTIVKLLNIDDKCMKLLDDFKPLKYRENIIISKDITFINDSKSTCVASTLYALNNIENHKNVILIIGGIDKKISYKQIENIDVAYVIVYGQIKDIVKHKRLIKCQTLDNAFKIAINILVNEKIILFSPITSSFDQFKNYIDRGNRFNKLVKLYEKGKL